MGALAIAERQARRVLAFLARGEALVTEAAEGGDVLLDGGDRGTIAVPGAVLGALRNDGRVRRDGRFVCLASRTRTGSDTVRAPIARPGFDPAESPLALLQRHRDRKGRPFLSDPEFRAGERLRSDYTIAQIMPKLGANWSEAVSSGRRSAAGAGVDLTDAALGARQRVDHAIRAVGPELAGVLVDVCCFLKGLARVETERGWPVRSAKVVLKTALGALARHYEPESHRRTALRHWGTPDYRPELDASGDGR